MSIRNFLIEIYYIIGIIFVSPLLILFSLIKNKQIIILDVRRWSEINDLDHRMDSINLLQLFFVYKEFRNVFYYRCARDGLLTLVLARFFNIFYSELTTLKIRLETNCDSGLFIHHGLCTIIAAKSIGKNCWINQQVTIGFKDKINSPTIGNNVVIASGSKVIGGITIGDNVKVGANAVVVKNVPDNCVVVGVPAYIIKRNGIKVKESL